MIRVFHAGIIVVATVCVNKFLDDILTSIYSFVFLERLKILLRVSWLLTVGANGCLMLTMIIRLSPLARLPTLFVVAVVLCSVL